MKGPSQNSLVGEADRLLARFAAERLHYTSQGFRARFLSYVYLQYPGESLKEFLEAASHTAEVNAKIHDFFRSPFKDGESLLLLIVLPVAGIAVISFYNGQNGLGILLISGSVMQTIATVHRFLKEYLQNELQMYIYRELKEIIDEELASLPCAAPCDS